MPSPCRAALVALALAVPFLLSHAPAARAASPESRITAPGMLRDIAAISDDSTQGRAPGTPGDARARSYLVRRLMEIGFQPGAEGGSWEQPITFVGLTVAPPAGWDFTGPAGNASFRWDAEFIGGSGVQAARADIHDAELVFVGYGIQAPEYQWDDFKGADLKGRVLLVMNNDPDWDPALFAGQRRLQYGRWDYKYESAARQGAAAVIILHTDSSAAYGWNVVRRSWSGTLFELPAGDEPRLQFKAWMTEPAVRRLLALAGKDLDPLIAAAKSRDFVPVPLGVRTSLAFDVNVERVQTANVVGVLPGSSALKDEAVVLSAHHDHLGVGAPDSTGDAIHNGALDNATGCAKELAIAEALAATRPRPKRSVLAVFVAGEEQGLLGSRYYVAHPTVPLARIAADINFDAGDILGRTRDVAVIGKGKCDLEDRLAALAARQHRVVVDEAEPDKGAYYRSDQLSFARGGVPSIYFGAGLDFIGRPAAWGKEKQAEYLRLHYHQPSDQVRGDWDLTGLVEDTRLAYALCVDVANAAKRPAWFEGDEFEAVRKRSLEAAAASDVK
jgi:Zn-dependent M28 family amino/carboxypeptidase